MREPRTCKESIDILQGGVTKTENSRYEEALDIIQEDGKEIASLRSDIARVTAELAEWKAKSEGTYCAYCGMRFPLDDEAATNVSEHISSCPKHPMRQVEHERDEALAKVDRLRAALQIVSQNYICFIDDEDRGIIDDALAGSGDGDKKS